MQLFEGYKPSLELYFETPGAEVNSMDGEAIMP